MVAMPAPTIVTSFPVMVTTEEESGSATNVTGRPDGVTVAVNANGASVVSLSGKAAKLMNWFTLLMTPSKLLGWVKL